MFDFDETIHVVDDALAVKIENSFYTSFNNQRAIDDYVFCQCNSILDGNANGVKELVVAGMLLASRDVIGGINWVQEHEEDGDIAKQAEKAKKYLNLRESLKTVEVNAAVVSIEKSKEDLALAEKEYDSVCESINIMQMRRLYNKI